MNVSSMKIHVRGDSSSRCLQFVLNNNGKEMAISVDVSEKSISSQSFEPSLNAALERALKVINE